MKVINKWVKVTLGFLSFVLGFLFCSKWGKRVFSAQYQYFLILFKIYLFIRFFEILADVGIQKWLKIAILDFEGKF